MKAGGGPSKLINRPKDKPLALRDRFKDRDFNYSLVKAEKYISQYIIFR